MYNSSFGGIESDGQLHRMQREYAQNAFQVQDQNDEEYKPQTEAVAETLAKPQSRHGLFSNSFLSGMQTDDLILIALGILLLNDSDSDNDILIILIAVLLFM